MRCKEEREGRGMGRRVEVRVKKMKSRRNNEEGCVKEKKMTK